MQSPPLQPGDPILRLVKSDWDRDFIRKSQFLPWLRNQLDVEPILRQGGPDEELLVSYVRRRLAVAQQDQENGKPTFGIRSTASPTISRDTTADSDRTVGAGGGGGGSGAGGSHPNDAPLRAHQQRSQVPPAPSSSSGQMSNPSSHADHASFSAFLAPPPTQQDHSLVDRQPTPEPMFGIDEFQADPDPYRALSMSRGNSEQGQFFNPAAFQNFLGTTGTPEPNFYNSSLGAIHDAHMGNAYYASAAPPPANGVMAQPPAGSVVAPMVIDSDDNGFAIDPALFTINGTARKAGSSNGFGWSGSMQELQDSTQPIAGPSKPLAVAAAKVVNAASPAAPSPPPTASTSAQKLAVLNPGAPVREKSTPPPTSASDFDHKAWSRSLPIVRKDLEEIRGAPPRAANKLAKLLDSFANGDLSSVPLEGRIEVLRGIKKNAPPAFYAAWINTEGKKGPEVTQAWLKGGVSLFEKSKGQTATEQERETYMTMLLEFCGRLPINTQFLLANKEYGKLIRRFNAGKYAAKYPKSVQESALAIENKWRGMNEQYQREQEGKSTPAVDSKRKAEAVADPGPKKRKVEVVKQPLATGKAAEDSMALFGSRVPAKAPEPKKLPSFSKKGKAPVKTEADAPAAATAPAAPKPISNAFEEALAHLKGRTVATSENDAVMAASGSSLDKQGRPKKRVSFATGDALAQIKRVEVAIYLDEDGNPWHVDGDVRSLDQAEGRSLMSEHKGIKPEMSWDDPEIVELGQEVLDYQSSAAPLVSPAADEQDEREKTVLMAFFASDEERPASAGEPEAEDSKPADDAEPPKIMKLSTELANDGELVAAIVNAQASLNPGAPLASDDQLQALLSNLTQSGLPASLGAPAKFDTNTLKGILGSLPTSQPPAPYSQPVASSSTGGWGAVQNSGWASQGAPLSTNPWEQSYAAQQAQQQSGSGRGRGKRGGGIHGGAKGSRTKVCHHWKRGNCQFGDRCDFRHGE